MALQPKMIACGNSVASFAMAVRFLTGPAVMAAASIAVGLRGNLLRVAIVQVFMRIIRVIIELYVNHKKFRLLPYENVILKIGGTSSRDCSICVCERVQCSSGHS